MLKTLKFIANHPLTREHRLAGYARFAKWQVQSRLCKEVEFKWINGAKLIARHGMTGATGNIYCGLHEFADMAFVLHLLRPNDLFVDVGANIGSYTILASAVAEAETIALEPDPVTIKALKRNVDANEVSKRVRIVECAAGADDGVTQFTVGLDTVNRVAVAGDATTRDVEVIALDTLLRGRNPVLIKMDIEGFEEEVLRGASATLQKPTLLAVETESASGQIASVLRDAGFERKYYEPHTRTLTDKKEHGDANALFIRGTEACEARLRSAPHRTILGHDL